MVAVLLVMGAVIPVLFAIPAQAQTRAEVDERDRLIAAQEALLNVYRCRFYIDAEIVPGGCANGSPTLPAVPAVPFAGTPTRADLVERDRLVAAQEVLLNVYRCRFDIDTETVPGGCGTTTDSRPPEIERPVLETRINAEIPVFYCAPEGKYTQSHLAEMVADLNQHVTPFFARESSGLMNVFFTVGGMVSPALDWQNTTLTDLYEQEGFSACDFAAIAAGKGAQILIIIDIETGDGIGGYATYNTGPSRVSFKSWGGPFGHGFRYNIAHELGHALLDLEHTDKEEVRAYDCAEVAWSVMNVSDECLNRSNIDPLSYYEVLCWQKEILGWPCFEPPPVVPGNIPRSYGSWTAYDSLRYDQLGVISYTRESEGLPDGSSPGLWMSCDYYESNEEWGLFAYVGWDDHAIFGDSDGDMRAGATFASGEVLSLTGYEGNEARFMNFKASSSFRLFNAVLQHEGVPLTISTTGRDGKVYSATFNTDGASIAVRSVLNFCALKMPDPVHPSDPVSSGVWRSYDSTNFAQLGVRTDAFLTEGVSDNNVPHLRMSCDLNESRGQWGLFSYVGWDGDSVYGDADGDMRAEATFANGDVVSLNGYEGTEARFMNFNAANSARLLNAILEHEGMPVTMSTTSRDGKVYSATFGTDGAAVALRSVKDYCDRK